MSRINRDQLRQSAESLKVHGWLKVIAKKCVSLFIAVLDLRIYVINRLVAQGLIKRPDVVLDLVEQSSLDAPIIGNPSVVIIAEVSIRQCYFYRVQQRAEQFEGLGYKVRIVAWNDHMEAMRLIYVSNLVFFYRVPYFNGVAALYERAKLLAKPTFFDIDDLIFDREIIEKRFDKERELLGETEYQGLLEGAGLYTASMKAADIVLASTKALANAMQDVVQKPVHVIANGLSNEEFVVPQIAGEYVDIIYGSGTNTHDRDFAQVIPALIDVLNRQPRARLQLVGKLSVDKRLLELGNRVVVHPMLDFDAYQQLLSRCHIALAPLEEGKFADAKSEIKWLEASVHGLASVVSRTATYEECIEEGINGFICSDSAAWRNAIETLIMDDAKRIEVVNAAQRSLMKNYSSAALSTNLKEIISPVEGKKGDFSASGTLSIRVNEAYAASTQLSVQREGGVIRYELHAKVNDADKWISELNDYLGVAISVIDS